MTKLFRVVQIETWRRVYHVEADTAEAAMAALRHVRLTPIEERCDRVQVVQTGEVKR